jgi:hypothetical protein
MMTRLCGVWFRDRTESFGRSSAWLAGQIQAKTVKQAESVVSVFRICGALYGLFRPYSYLFILKIFVQLNYVGDTTLINDVNEFEESKAGHIHQDTTGKAKDDCFS